MNNNKTQPIRAQRPSRLSSRSEVMTQTLTFSPMAWLKLRLFLHGDNVEVGGFGISSKDDLLYIEEFVTVPQMVTIASVEFYDDAVADHFDRYADEGIPPARCGRIWIHTHPGDSPLPSFTDEKTFDRVFGSCDWAAMVIVARNGDTYARLRFSAGPGGESIIPVTTDWERYSQDLLDQEGTLDDRFSAWMDEYGSNIHHRPVRELPPIEKTPQQQTSRAYADRMDELDQLYDQQMLMDEFFEESPAEVYP